jgi:hypothetical protein
MSCYYPLIGLPHGITSSVTYSSHTLNQRAGSLRVPHQHAVDLALYRVSDGRWQLRDRLPLAAPGEVVVTSSGQGLAPGELLVCVPVARDAVLEPSPAELPLPLSKRIDRSPVAERCSLSFAWRGISSAYQGEYPLRMAELSRGTLVSFDPLLQSDPAVGTNLVCVVNISRRVDDTLHSLECFDAGTRRLIRAVPYRSNSCCLIEFDAAAVAAGPLVFRSTGSLGIPIFLTLSRPDLPPSMSVEQTHPPTEMFWDRDRLPGSRRLKATWLAAALR